MPNYPPLPSTDDGYLYTTSSDGTLNLFSDITSTIIPSYPYDLVATKDYSSNQTLCKFWPEKNYYEADYNGTHYGEKDIYGQNFNDLNDFTHIGIYGPGSWQCSSITYLDLYTQGNAASTSYYGTVGPGDYCPKQPLYGSGGFASGRMWKYTPTVPVMQTAYRKNGVTNYVAYGDIVYLMKLRVNNAVNAGTISNSAGATMVSNINQMSCTTFRNACLPQPPSSICSQPAISTTTTPAPSTTTTTVAPTTTTTDPTTTSSSTSTSSKYLFLYVVFPIVVLLLGLFYFFKRKSRVKVTHRVGTLDNRM